MGQAFDEKGNVLGEAYGETKREVFDKLIEAHPNAAEMRIKSIVEKEQEAVKKAQKAEDTNVDEGDPMRDERVGE